jgi:dTDP-4-dehydrorhamnose 3,5-epimerase
MKFTPGSVEDVWEVDIEPVADHRGFFARTWCEKEFADHGLVATWPQQNLQSSPRAGTMRGFHYQIPPHSEVKLVRCTRGAVFDVALDIRPDSPTFGRWSGTVLRAADHKAVWVPEGCAHAYLTLEDDSEVFYLTSHTYVPSAVRGVRFDDPFFAVEWPRSVEMVPADYDDWAWFDDERAEELRPNDQAVQP